MFDLLGRCIHLSYMVSKNFVQVTNNMLLCTERTYSEFISFVIHKITVKKQDYNGVQIYILL